MTAAERKALKEVRKLEKAGDYGAATKELEAAAAWADSVDRADANAVRQKVNDLTRLAEMKWRCARLHLAGTQTTRPMGPHHGPWDPHQPCLC